jgi:hypothetical protein
MCDNKTEIQHVPSLMRPSNFSVEVVASDAMIY